jgi:hypothetical protein
VRRAAAGALAALALIVSGCGGKDAPSDTEQVRATMLTFGKATAAHDYKRMCDLLAPALLEKLRQVGLPCEQALEQGLGEVRSPKLSVGKITVDGDSARAEVRTSAEGETPSDDTVELRRVNGSWRVSSLAGTAEPGPAP